MVEIVSLTCSSCGGKLQIPATVEQFACGYCGTEFTVNRGGGIVSLAPVVDGLKHVQRGVDKTASLGLSGLGTFVFCLGVLLIIGGQLLLGSVGVLVGILWLVSAFNGSKKKVQELDELERQYAAVIKEIDSHKVIVRG